MFGFITTPGFTLERTSPTTNIALDARFDFAEYIDHSEFNSQDQFLNLNVNHAITEGSAFLFSGNFTRDTTLRSDQDITGRFLDDLFCFISWNVTPGWAYLLSPVDQIAVRSFYRQVDYDTNEKTDFQYLALRSTTATN